MMRERQRDGTSLNCSSECSPWRRGASGHSSTSSPNCQIPRPSEPIFRLVHRIGALLAPIHPSQGAAGIRRSASAGLTMGIRWKDFRSRRWASPETQTAGDLIGIRPREAVFSRQGRDGFDDNLGADDRRALDNGPGLSLFFTVVGFCVDDDVGVSECTHGRRDRLG
jgi:hypothetical protein